MIVGKFQLLALSGPQDVAMPLPATVVHVHEQHGTPMLWVEIDPSRTVVLRTFHVFATGEPIDQSFNYVGTVHIDWTVWHVYEAKP